MLSEVQQPFRKKVILFAFVLCSVIGITGLLYVWNEKSLMGIDDANIYFVYMRHFAHGEGFVYNLGGERVEGFTSLLWCLLGALFFSFFRHPEIALLATNIAVVGYTLWNVFLFADACTGDKRPVTPSTVFVLLALVLFPGYFEWTVLSLLETGIWSCLLVLTSLNLLRWEQGERTPAVHRELYLFLVLLPFTRPESYVWGSFFVATRALQVYRNRKKITRPWLVPALLPAGIFTTTAVGLVLWRLYYFGYPLPNTYYAKVSQDTAYNIREGLLYLWEFVWFVTPFLYCVPVILLLYALLAKKRYGLGFTGILCAVILITALIPLYSGGDHFGLGRLLQPTLPLVYLGVFLFAKAILGYPLGKKAYVFTVLVVLAFAFVPVRDGILNSLKTGHGPIRMGFVIAKHDCRFGERLSHFFADLPNYPSHGVITAGGNAFCYQGPTIDLLGLNNVEMAHADRIKMRNILKGHASFNKDVFYRQKPDLLWLCPTRFIPVADTATAEPPENYPEFKDDLINLALKGLAFDARFRETYLPVYIHKTGEPECVFGYAHKDFLSRLPQPLYTYGVLPRAR